MVEDGSHAKGVLESNLVDVLIIRESDADSLEAGIREIGVVIQSILKGKKCVSNAGNVMVENVVDDCITTRHGGMHDNNEGGNMSPILHATGDVFGGKIMDSPNSSSVASKKKRKKQSRYKIPRTVIFLNR